MKFGRRIRDVETTGERENGNGALEARHALVDVIIYIKDWPKFTRNWRSFSLATAAEGCRWKFGSGGVSKQSLFDWSTQTQRQVCAAANHRPPACRYVPPHVISHIYIYYTRPADG